MVFSKTGRVQDDFYVLGHTWMPIYLLDGERPVLFEAGLTCLGRIYEEAIRSVLSDRQPEILFLTHVHYEHCGATSYLKEVFPSLQVGASPQAAQIIQLDVGQCGGILESKKIAGMAEAFYAMIAPHMFCGPVAFAAALQLNTCSPNFLIQEYNFTDLHSEIFEEPIKYENGFITPPAGPGLGIKLNEKVVRRQLSAKG